jgi:hypothetical protein
MERSLSLRWMLKLRGLVGRSQIELAQHAMSRCRLRMMSPMESGPDADAPQMCDKFPFFLPDCRRSYPDIRALLYL